MDSSKVDYLINAAKQSRYNAKHWLRYLRKEFNGDECRLSSNELSALINSDELTMYQKISLKQAANPGTATNRYIIELNQPAKTPMLDLLLRRNKNV